MDTSAMVKKIAILATGIIVALSIIAILRLTRRCKCNEYRESKQCYGVVPKWIDEEFPLPKNGEDIETNPEKPQ